MIYQQIVKAKQQNTKLLAVLLDPEKVAIGSLESLCQKINQSEATHILVGGSSFQGDHLNEMLSRLKAFTHLPLLLFPGHPSQVSDKADGLLFLALLSGRNPDYLIGYQIQAVPLVEKTHLEVLSTAYLLIASGSPTAVQRVSQTQPLDRDNLDLVAHTAKAGEYLGQQLVYLEAGSGAQMPVPEAMIKRVAQTVNIPLVVGGGIRSKKDIQKAYDAGADMVVIGTAFENDPNFFEHD